ncbi:hypothetical protein JOB18_023058 [Solea senegalensis]|uniref:Uncharacterized protein n=1 Tax=Solea senegalensis TaxID=28829 RepID=A0AAV6T738_SOLSE|nr:hypothetical protein JOB18_023058 [Solea senegalensis]
MYSSKCLSNKKKKKKREEQISDVVRQTRCDSTSCVKKKYGASESVGNCGNRQILSGGLFSSAPLPLRGMSLCVLTWSNHYGLGKLDSPAEGCDLVRVSAVTWLPEDRLRAAERLICAVRAGL